MTARRTMNMAYRKKWNPHEEEAQAAASGSCGNANAHCGNRSRFQSRPTSLRPGACWPAGRLCGWTRLQAAGPASHFALHPSSRASNNDCGGHYPRKRTNPAIRWQSGCAMVAPHGHFQARRADRTGFSEQPQPSFGQGNTASSTRDAYGSGWIDVLPTG